MNVVAIVQARMGSERLPGKVLADINGRPMLEHVLRRLARCETLDETVVATTMQPRDDAIAELCTARGWTCFRGAELDVLDRYRSAAAASRADVVVRVTSDCPLIDAGVVDATVGTLIARLGHLDYAANFLPLRTFPRGLDAEAFTAAALERAWREDDNPVWREHATEYILHHPDRFRIEGIMTDPDYSHLRWTVDMPDDLRLVRSIFQHFGEDRFGWRDVLNAYDQHPEWREINAHVRQKELAEAAST